jgi:anti-sigma factor RsiW
MTCRALVDFLSAYLDGALTPGERLRFDAHLAACPECRAYLRTYEATVKLARDAFDRPDDPVPADVPEELVQAILAARRTR